MDVTTLGKEGLRVHEKMTAELGEALDSREPGAVKALFESWNAVHESRRQEVRELRRAIQRAENHFKMAEADQLRVRLAELEG